MSSMNPGKAYTPSGSLSATPHGQPIPGLGTVGTANAKGALPAKNGGSGKRTTSEGPLKPAMARKSSTTKGGK